ncbi:PucR family transcriptional regulator ligand-binding domain-containing protein [Peptostreptococcaceae bacterium AGR-M142]
MIKIKDLLKLRTFESFKLLCGNKGIINNVSKIGILDYEVGDEVRKNFYEGEFVLTNFLMGKENKEIIKEIIIALIDIKASGLAIKPIYIKALSKDILDYANKNNFPIFFYYDSFFEDILNDFSKARETKEIENNLALNIKKLMNDNLSSDFILETVLNINKNLYSNYLIASIKPKDEKYKVIDIPKEWDISRVCSLIYFKDIYFFIYSFKEYKGLNKSYRDILLTLDLIGVKKESHYIAISCEYFNLNKLNIALLESINALKLCDEKNDIILFKNLGPEKFLLPLLDNIWINKYYEDIINIIIEYDSKNNSNLVKTGAVYYLNNRDFKKSAELLYQHENTIRYRIKKINELLFLNHINIDNIDLSLIFNIYKLKNII